MQQSGLQLLQFGSDTLLVVIYIYTDNKTLPNIVNRRLFTFIFTFSKVLSGLNYTRKDGALFKITVAVVPYELCSRWHYLTKIC